VAWVGVDANDALDELQDGTEEACAAAGLGREERPFRPHITVARIRPPRDLRPILAGSEPIDLAFAVNQVTVLRSHPGGRIPRYEPLEVFALPS